jgi:glc operon protein GlcG
MSLSLEEANRVIQGALAKATELGIKVSVAICDGGGRLVAFQRMDNAIWASTFASQGKAIASSATGHPSGAFDNPTIRGVVAAEGGHMILGQGGIAVLRDGVVEGACGVAGGSSQQDEDCARSGVEHL